MEDVDSESPERQEPPLEQRQGIPASENQLGSRISLRENYVDDGAAFSLTARVQGVPTPEILWYRSGKRLKSTMSAKMTSLDDSYSLYIAEARVEKDAGEYKCVASNVAGKTGHSCTVHVKKNVFVDFLKDTEADEESDVVFKCVTKEGTNVTWYHDDEPIVASKDVVFQPKDKVQLLILRNVTKAHSGTYRCSFDNQNTECDLWVHEPLPEFLRKLGDREVMKREPVTFVVELSPETAKVTWRKDGEPLDVASDRYEFSSEGKERRYIIRSVSIHHEGKYTCSLGGQECTAKLGRHRAAARDPFVAQGRHGAQWRSGLLRDRANQGRRSRKLVPRHHRDSVLRARPAGHRRQTPTPHGLRLYRRRRQRVLNTSTKESISPDQAVNPFPCQRTLVSFSRCNIPDDQFRQLGFFWEKNGSVALKNFSTLPRTWMIFSSLEMLDCAGLQMRFSSEGGHRCSRFCIQSGMPLVGKSSPNVVLVVFFCLNVGDPQFCLTN